jgi:hypothetical protein
MHDFGCKEAKDIYYPELAEGVRHFKEEGGRKIMCEAVEKYAEKYAEKYTEKYAEKIVRHMLAKGKTAEEIADLCGFELEFVQQAEERMRQTV